MKVCFSYRYEEFYKNGFGPNGFCVGTTVVLACFVKKGFAAEGAAPKMAWPVETCRWSRVLEYIW